MVDSNGADIPPQRTPQTDILTPDSWLGSLPFFLIPGHRSWLPTTQGLPFVAHLYPTELISLTSINVSPLCWEKGEKRYFQLATSFPLILDQDLSLSGRQREWGVGMEVKANWALSGTVFILTY